MTIGPGKYNDVCTYVRKRTRARAVILLVLEGSSGEGFEVQTADPMLLLRLPQLLREIAESIEADALNDAAKLRELMERKR